MATDSEITSQEEVQSALQSDEQEQSKNEEAFSFLGQQSSIYSLTIDKFQNTLCDGSKNFGSMNMDEFLNSIWIAEENQAQAQTTTTTAAATTTAPITSGGLFPQAESTTTQPILARQGSLTLPPPLYQKTVDEVWSEINKTEQQQQRQQHNTNNVGNPNSAHRQPTFGEMTLEDFLVKAGVVRERGHLPVPVPPQPPPSPYVPYHSTSNPAIGPCYITRPIMGLGAGGASVGVPGYPTVLPESGMGETQSYIGSGSSKRTGAYQPPMSPVSVDGPSLSHVDSANQYGLNKGGMRGGPVEKVVERRQRRMIKNRESAARARARKQAYTVELEVELNQLKEENAHLKQALADLERKRKQQMWFNLMVLFDAECFDEVEVEMKVKGHTRAQKAKEKLRMIRRNLSCPY